MISNQYICELDFDISRDELLKLILSPPEEGLKPHQRSAETYEYTKSILDKFSFLSPLWNIYNLPPFGKMPLHIDGKRSAAINIPILGTQGSKTRFFKSKENLNTNYNETRVWFEIKDELELDFEFELVNPTLINNLAPHDVINGANRRIIVSWSIKDNISFDEAKEFLYRLA